MDAGLLIREAPEDMWLAGTDVSDLLDDAGDVDPTKVAEAAAKVVQDRPHWKRTRHTPDPDQGQRSTGPSTSWSSILGRRG